MLRLLVPLLMILDLKQQRYRVFIISVTLLTTNKILVIKCEVMQKALIEGIFGI